MCTSPFARVSLPSCTFTACYAATVATLGEAGGRQATQSQHENDKSSLSSIQLRQYICAGMHLAASDGHSRQNREMVGLQQVAIRALQNLLTPTYRQSISQPRSSCNHLYSWSGAGQGEAPAPPLPQHAYQRVKLNCMHTLHQGCKAANMHITEPSTFNAE